MEVSVNCIVCVVFLFFASLLNGEAVKPYGNETVNGNEAINPCLFSKIDFESMGIKDSPVISKKDLIDHWHKFQDLSYQELFDNIDNTYKTKKMECQKDSSLEEKLSFLLSFINMDLDNPVAETLLELAMLNWDIVYLGTDVCHKLLDILVEYEQKFAIIRAKDYVATSPLGYIGDTTLIEFEMRDKLFSLCEYGDCSEIISFSVACPMIFFDE